MDWSKLIENKDVRSALIVLFSAVLTAVTEGLAQLVGTSMSAATATAVMGCWSIAVNAVQTRVRQWLADVADDAAGAELRKATEERASVLGPAEFVETYEPRSLDPNFPPAPPSRLAELRELADDHGYTKPANPTVSGGKWRGSTPLLAIAAILSLAACAAAAPPRAIITGPNTGTPGEFITLDASDSEGTPKHFRWSIAPELRGRKQLLPSLSGERCTVASFPGRYLVTLAVANDDGIDSLTWQIEIPGVMPCPPPEPQPVAPQPIVPPGPTPIPQPVNPVTPVNPQPVDNTPGPGEFGIAAEVYRAALAATSPTRAQDCQRLAAECRRIAGGQADSLNALATQMVAVLVTLPAGWDILKSKVKTTVATLAVSGRIKSAADLQRLLLELADAFERAAK